MDSVSTIDIKPRKNSKNSSGHETNSTYFEKIMIFLRTITVEPLGVLFITPSRIYNLSNENMNLEKACLVNLGYNETVCQAMVLRDRSGYSPEEEIEVQKLVSSMIPFKSASAVLPVILLFTLGAWSDRTGRRKPILLVPFIGDIIGVLGFILCIYFFMELRMEYAIFFESIPLHLFGGYQLLQVAMFSYIASISDEKSRTVRIGGISVISRSSMTLGIALSGVMYKYLGYYWVYSIALCLYLFGLLYTLFYIEETYIEISDNSSKDNENMNGCHQLCNLQIVKSNLKLCFKAGPNRRRTKMILVLIVNIINYGVTSGENMVLYLYARKQFGWDEVDFSMFKTFKMIVQITGGLFVLIFLAKYLKWSDTKIGVLSTISYIIGSIVLAFAGNGTVFYCGAIAEAFNGATIFAVKSIISKTVCPDEQAQAFSMTSILESFSPVVFGSLYSMLYYETISSFPGAIFIFSMIMNIPILILYYVLHNIISMK